MTTEKTTEQQLAELRTILAAKEAEIASLKKPAVARVARKLTPEQEAAKALRDAHEAVTLAEVGTPLRYIQDQPRISQIDAAPKLLRMLPWARVAPLLLSMAEDVFILEAGKMTLETILAEATHRVAKVKSEQKTEEPTTEQKEGESTEPSSEPAEESSEPAEDSQGEPSEEPEPAMAGGKRKGKK